MGSEGENNKQLSWTLWQLLDSILPTGGFAYSSGLEAAVQAGSVSDSISLENFVVSSIENTAALLLPFVFAASKSSSLESWKHLDCVLHATLSNKVARRSSVAQGTALLRVASSLFQENTQLKEMRANVHVHHAPVFGFVCGLLHVDPMTAQRAFLFVSLRDMLSAATRLNVIGPLEAALMQHRVAVKAEVILNRYANRPIQDAHQTAPVIDVIQGFHDHLFSRLFRS